jgi:hypothetical protein
MPYRLISWGESSCINDTSCHHKNSLCVHCNRYSLTMLEIKPKKLPPATAGISLTTEITLRKKDSEEFSDTLTSLSPMLVLRGGCLISQCPKCFQHSWTHITLWQVASLIENNAWPEAGWLEI